MTRDVPGLDALLSHEGWPYASSLPVIAGDPGRFHALFGRDALITSLQVLPARPEVARATLAALARRQGRRHDPGTLEAPGKIGHEFRDEPPDSFEGWPPGPFGYYGSADATAWFVVLLGRVDDPTLTAELRPALEAAAGWLRGALDEGSGLVRHAPGSLPGLSQQGWRDCIDPIRDGNGGGTLRPDGTAPRPPLADADTQAVTVAALAELHRLTGQDEWAERQSRLRALITQTFLPDVLMVDADGPIAGAGSALGWFLWAGALEPDAVGDAAERLSRPDILTEHGLRTLSSESPVFRYDAYHRGSIWPFDSWLGWGGLRAAGREAAAEQVRRGVLGALDDLGGHPELYAVPPGGRPEQLPVANREQAWTVGARWALLHEWDGRSALTPAVRA